MSTIIKRFQEVDPAIEEVTLNMWLDQATVDEMDPMNLYTPMLHGARDPIRAVHVGLVDITNTQRHTQVPLNSQAPLQLSHFVAWSGALERHTKQQLWDARRASSDAHILQDINNQYKFWSQVKTNTKQDTGSSGALHRRKVVIVGAGISGLVCAIRIHEMAGVPMDSIVLLEKGPDVGGVWN